VPVVKAAVMQAAASPAVRAMWRHVVRPAVRAAAFVTRAMLAVVQTPREVAPKLVRPVAVRRMGEKDDGRRPSGSIR
jgi:hypothetical protein